MNDDRKYRYRAMTLVEVLVVMILSAIVLSLLWEGASLFIRHSGRMVARITANGEFYNDYARIEGLVTTADSLIDHSIWIEIYRGSTHARIREYESSLVVALGGRTDTLFRGMVTSFQAFVSNYRTRAMDSVVIQIRQPQQSPLRIALSPIEHPQREALRKIEKQEKEYRYD